MVDWLLNSSIYALCVPAINMFKNVVSYQGVKVAVVCNPLGLGQSGQVRILHFDSRDSLENGET